MWNAGRVCGESASKDAAHRPFCSAASRNKDPLTVPIHYRDVLSPGGAILSRRFSQIFASLPEDVFPKMPAVVCWDYPIEALDPCKANWIAAQTIMAVGPIVFRIKCVG